MPMPIEAESLNLLLKQNDLLSSKVTSQAKNRDRKLCRVIVLGYLQTECKDILFGDVFFECWNNQ